MTDTLEPLVRDLVEWIARAPRSYLEVLEAWRTSCPRLPVWETAVDKGYVRRVPDASHNSTQIVVTTRGRKFLRRIRH